MTDTLDVATDAKESLAIGLVKDLGKATAQTAVSVAGAIVVLTAVGFVLQKRDERRARKANQAPPSPVAVQ